VREGTRSIALGAGGVALAASLCAATAAETGCFAHTCDSSEIALGGAGEPAVAPAQTLPSGEIVWSSGWLDFSSQRTIDITFPQAFAAPPDIVGCEVAADPQDPQNNFVLCGANLAQFSHATERGLVVFNPNCTSYGLRFEARGLPASGAGTDAGAMADAPGD
jgi:hypothetical protein